MKVNSAYTPKEYIHHMRCHMSAHTEFGTERFTGFFAGRFFYVTRHSGFEWNRKITNQKNAALGYVKQAATGSEVRFIRFRGAFCPMVFLPLFLFFYVAYVVMFLYIGLQEFYGIGSILLISLGLTAPVFAIYLPFETFMESLTEKSEEGHRILLSFLKDPADPYKNLSHAS